MNKAGVFASSQATAYWSYSALRTGVLATQVCPAAVLHMSTGNLLIKLARRPLSWLHTRQSMCFTVLKTLGPCSALIAHPKTSKAGRLPACQAWHMILRMLCRGWPLCWQLRQLPGLGNGTTALGRTLPAARSSRLQPPAPSKMRPVRPLPYASKCDSHVTGPLSPSSPQRERWTRLHMSA